MMTLLSPCPLSRLRPRPRRSLPAAPLNPFPHYTTQLHFPTARMRLAAQKPGETLGEGVLPTCAMSLEAAAILLKVLGATGVVSPAADALAKKNPAIQASAKQLAEAGKKMHPTLNQVRVLLCCLFYRR